MWGAGSRVVGGGTWEGSCGWVVRSPRAPTRAHRGHMSIDAGYTSCEWRRVKEGWRAYLKWGAEFINKFGNWEFEDALSEQVIQQR